jgi:predicted nucleic acid-binding protein
LKNSGIQQTTELLVRLSPNIGLTNQNTLRTIVPMKIIADTNTFIAVALNEPEKDKIIQLTEGHDLIAPDVLPFEIGNALTAMMKKNILKKAEVESAWEIIQQIPVDLRHTNIKSALSIAIEYNLYAYDAYFLECTYNLRSPLLTLDLGMQKVARQMGITILE